MKDLKEIKRQEFTITHNQSTYTTVKGITKLKKMIIEMQQKDSLIISHPTNKYSQPRPISLYKHL